jgi:hypothetical protein
MSRIIVWSECIFCDVEPEFLDMTWVHLVLRSINMERVVEQKVVPESHYSQLFEAWISPK